MLMRHLLAAIAILCPIAAVAQISNPGKQAPAPQPPTDPAISLGDVYDAGSMAFQYSTGVSVTGGNIDGTKIGSILPSTGRFTGLGSVNDAVTGGTTTLSVSQYGNTHISFTGTLTGNATVNFPPGVTGAWDITNLTSGAFTLTLQVPGQSSPPVVLQNSDNRIWSDGTTLQAAAYLLAGNGFVTGPLTSIVGNLASFSTTNGGAVTDTGVIAANVLAPGAWFFPDVTNQVLVVTGSTVTANHPVVDATQAWNASATAFTGWRLNVTNTASAATSKLIDLQVGGVSEFNVSPSGTITAPTAGLYQVAAATVLRSTSAVMCAACSYQWSNSTIWNATVDTALSRSAAGVVAVNASSGGTAAAGSLAFRDLRLAKTANYTVLTTDTNTVFDNCGASGEVDFTLPTIASGLRYGFYVCAAQTVKVIAAGSKTIFFGTTQSASNGNVTQASVGAFIQIGSPSNASAWQTVAHEATWTVN